MCEQLSPFVNAVLRWQFWQVKLYRMASWCVWLGMISIHMHVVARTIIPASAIDSVVAAVLHLEVAPLTLRAACSGGLSSRPTGTLLLLPPGFSSCQLS